MRLRNIDITEKGFMLDQQNRLQWTLCCVGQKRVGRSCTGEPAKVSWNKIQSALERINGGNRTSRHPAWRVPTPNEIGLLHQINNLSIDRNQWFWATNQNEEGENAFLVNLKEKKIRKADLNMVGVLILVQTIPEKI